MEGCGRFVLIVTPAEKNASKEQGCAMTFEEFEIATNQDLTGETKRCFDRYNNSTTGSSDKPAWLLEAQFYMQELGRREDSRVARRDFWMEVAVIFLIGVEIVLAVYGTRLAIKQANDQDALMTKQMEALNRLNQNVATTAGAVQSSLAAMQSMNDRIGLQLGRMAQVKLDFRWSNMDPEKSMNITNHGNVDLDVWGYKVFIGTPVMIRKPIALRRGEQINRVGNLFPDVLRAEAPKSGGYVPIELYLCDDFGNEYVGSTSVMGHSITGGMSGNFEIVEKEWRPGSCPAK
jgi:hypothetical protein